MKELTPDQNTLEELILYSTPSLVMSEEVIIR